MSSDKAQQSVNHFARYRLAIFVIAVIVSASVLAALYPRTTRTTSVCDGLRVWEAIDASQNSVLLMRPGSIGYICVIYEPNYQYHYYQRYMYSILPRAPVTPGRGEDVWNFSLHIFNIKFTRENGSVTLECCIVSNSFRINASPSSIQIYRGMGNVTVLYTVEALANSTGFYDGSAPYDGCKAMPMAVGYSASQVNASDFAPVPIFIEGMPCVVGSAFFPVSVSISGMAVTYIELSRLVPT